MSDMWRCDYVNNAPVVHRVETRMMNAGGGDKPTVQREAVREVLYRMLAVYEVYGVRSTRSSSGISLMSSTEVRRLEVALKELNLPLQGCLVPTFSFLRAAKVLLRSVKYFKFMPEVLPTKKFSEGIEI